jgi:CubicO group peptidase (beta-lactamase class C family)
VRAAFAENFASRGEVVASVCIIRDHEVLVDLWGGWADEACTRPWQADTLVDFYSAGKGVAAALMLQLIDQGVLGLDTPVADVWPEFAAHGKHEVTVRHALCHEATVPAIRAILTDDDLFDWATMTAALADTAPWWPLGTRHAYHTNTFGHLVGEIVHRASGEMPQQRLRRITDTIGADVFFGVPDTELARCADVIWASVGSAANFDVSTLEGYQLMYALAHFNPPGYSSIGLVNTRAWRQAQVPSTNGHGSARGVARFYDALITPDLVLSPATVATAATPQALGPCPMLGEDLQFGIGFQPTSARRPLGTNPHSFGHFGTGGALGFGDPEGGIAFGYVMNHVIPRWQSTRNRALIDTFYACLG